MTLYAVDTIGDAIDATREFLLPLSLGRWAKLALVVFFIGGASSGNPLRFSGSASGNVSRVSSDGSMPVDDLPALDESLVTLIAAVVVALLVVGLVFALVSAIMEFVFVESLRRERVTLRRYWSEYLGQGIRLFGFRLGLGALTFAVLGGLAALVLFPALSGDGGLSVALLLLAVPVGLVVLLVSGLVHVFTTVFVVPVMMAEDRQVLSAWRRFWPTLTGQWKQYLVYALVLFGLQLATGIAAGIVTAVAAFAIGIPLAIIGVIGFVLVFQSSAVGWAVVVLAVVLFVLAMLVVGLLVGVPVRTFLRYHALLVLGDTNEAFDLIPERRRALRNPRPDTGRGPTDPGHRQ